MVTTITGQCGGSFSDGEVAVQEKSRRSQERREALLQSAAKVFLEQGYEATSIDAIIGVAGGSKRSIYSEFGNKQGLFTAIVTQSADRALSTLVLEEIESSDLPTTLQAFGRNLMEVYMSPALIGIYRIAVTEANRFPDLVRSFYDQGPGRATSRLSRVLEQAAGRGEIQVADCERAAGHFVAMIRDNLHLQVVLGLRLAPSRKEMHVAVDSAVDLFLHGVGAQGPGKVRQRR